MKLSKLLALAGVITAAIALLVGPAQAAPAARPAMRAACPAARPGQMRCLALYAPQVTVNQAIAAGIDGGLAQPKGWGAISIESAYKLPAASDPGQTVAVVDAYSTPRLVRDLAVYRKEYGLSACGTASGCLKIVNQQGKAAPLPAPDPRGWGVETTLDASMVSAACPNCHILVVEADSPSVADLSAAEDTAARLGAEVISNSYGTPETGYALHYAADYRHPGHAIVVSAGDSGFTAADFPADLATVTTVGGTQLTRASNKRGWSERVWNTGSGASGSGCSAYVAKPAWQRDADCHMRTAANVAALAWNIALYDSSVGGWQLVGGTSAAAPLIAAVYALAGNAATVSPGYPYQHTSALFNVTTGNNDWFHNAGGATCGHDYLCQATQGYDGPTGLGTPDGTSAF